MPITGSFRCRTSPEVQVLSKGLLEVDLGKRKVGPGEEAPFLLGLQAWAPRVSFSNQKHLGWDVIVVSQLQN